MRKQYSSSNNVKSDTLGYYMSMASSVRSKLLSIHVCLTLGLY